VLAHVSSGPNSATPHDYRGRVRGACVGSCWCLAGNALHGYELGPVLTLPELAKAQHAPADLPESHLPPPWTTPEPQRCSSRLLRAAARPPAAVPLPGLWHDLRLRPWHTLLPPAVHPPGLRPAGRDERGGPQPRRDRAGQGPVSQHRDPPVGAGGDGGTSVQRPHVISDSWISRPGKLLTPNTHDLRLPAARDPGR
jgi:hypothetical protein